MTATGPAATALLPDPQRIDNLLKDDVITSMAIGMVPFPLFDTALLALLQVRMVEQLCREYGVPFSHRYATAVVSAAIGALPIVSALGVSALIKAVPGLGTLAGGAAASLLSGALTYAQGRVLIQHFESGGTLMTFDPARLRARLHEEFERGRSYAAALARSDEV